MKTKLISFVGLCLMAILVLAGCSKDESPENKVNVTVSGSSFTFNSNYELEIPFMVSPSDYDASGATIGYDNVSFTSSGPIGGSLGLPPSVSTIVKKDVSVAGKWIMSCKLKDAKTGDDFVPGDGVTFSYSATASLMIGTDSYASFGISASNK